MKDPNIGSKQSENYIITIQDQKCQCLLSYLKTLRAHHKLKLRSLQEQPICKLLVRVVWRKIREKIMACSNYLKTKTKKSWAEKIQQLKSHQSSLTNKIQEDLILRMKQMLLLFLITMRTKAKESQVCYIWFRTIGGSLPPKKECVLQSTSILRCLFLSLLQNVSITS
jgi:hypothetical protein